MHELVPIGVVGIVFYFTYKMIELPSRRREREMMIVNTALAHGGYSMNKWSEEQLFEVAYGAPVLIFGGLGLLCSYLLERRLSTDDKQRSERP